MVSTLGEILVVKMFRRFGMLAVIGCGGLGRDHRAIEVGNILFTTHS
ncbi:hypothetical protein DFR67_1424 [Williamsia limnetica]|uniref:Uncharacterized protein n=1 Tax=Williamsia limnetica TaxID=882452 RepID=A0A318RF79_WILLI|nr:hypothetical protein DFR67_1424 [Williamsia limnetica]